MIRLLVVLLVLLCVPLSSAVLAQVQGASELQPAGEQAQEPAQSVAVSEELTPQLDATRAPEAGQEAQSDLAAPEVAPPEVAPPEVAPIESTPIDPFDEFEMVRAMQDRADAERAAREETERARADEDARRAEARRQEDRELDLREREATVQHLRQIDERLNSRPDPVEPFAPTIIVDESGVFAEELESFVQTFGTDRSFSALLVLLFGVLLAAMLAGGVRRIRDGLAPKGILPTVFAFVHLATRLLVVALVVAFVVRFLPPRMSLVLLLAFAGAALALGWSARDVLPDLIAGIVLAFERRVRRGMWLSSKEFSGQVEHVGFRSSSLRDAQGNEVSVPNRFILGAPIATDSTREREQDVTLRLTGESAPALREAIIDAVLGSPWVAPRHRPLVYRDPDEPELWRVRARLLEAQYGVRFEGELLERTEAILEAIVARNEAAREGEQALAQVEEPGDKEPA